MAFPKKTWKDRVSEQPQRRLITPVGGSTSTTVDVTRQEGIVIQEGDAFSAANMNDLENRIKTTFDADEASIRTVNTRSTTNANNIASLQNNINTINNSITSLNNNKAPTNHASSGTTYGKGTYNTFGHLKISDNMNAGTAADGVAASSRALGDAYSNLRIHDNIIENQLYAPQAHAPFYFDWQNGKYGFNTDVNRGADTFHPFKTNKYQGISLGAGAVLAFQDARSDEQEFKYLTLDSATADVKVWFQNPADPSQRTEDVFLTVGSKVSLIQPSGVDPNWPLYLFCGDAAHISLTVE